jgi:4-alpha-glucanotransferase
VTEHTRRAGLLLPLFSLRGVRDWGIGEIGDLPALMRWLRDGEQRLLQLLPINELPDHETSPYSALSGMAIDPRYISLRLLPDHAMAGDDAGPDASTAGRLQEARRSSRVRYAEVRALKEAAFRRAYARFVEVELRLATPRGARLRRLRARAGVVARHLRDLSRASVNGSAVSRGPSGRPRSATARGRDRRSASSAGRAKCAIGSTCSGWPMSSDERPPCRARGGRLRRPAVHGGARQRRRMGPPGPIRLDASLGVPPDVFSETGQDWALPVYRWDVMEQRGFEWLVARARRNADLFDGYRVDHLVGFFRTFFREPSGDSGFTPAEEPDQTALGERILRLFLASGATIVAEDLGVVPDFVRASMARLDVPGCKVFRWERGGWRMASRSWIPPTIPCDPSPPPARTTPNRS